MAGRRRAALSRPRTRTSAAMWRVPGAAGCTAMPGLPTDNRCIRSNNCCWSRAGTGRADAA
ncbi:MAG: hypothetical protein MZW92_57310 [Comamonadaceae bacterium]|nr:hypothetical protein [Comamonadaceae bacterium]